MNVCLMPVCRLGVTFYWKGMETSLNFQKEKWKSKNKFGSVFLFFSFLSQTSRSRSIHIQVSVTAEYYTILYSLSKCLSHDTWNMTHDTWCMYWCLYTHMSRDLVSSVCKISRSIKIYNSFWPGPHNLSSYLSGSLSLTITFLSQIPTPVPVMVCDGKI